MCLGRREVERKQVDVLGDVPRVAGYGDHSDPLLDQPSQPDLRGAHAVGVGDALDDRVVEELASVPDSASAPGAVPSCRNG